MQLKFENVAELTGVACDPADYTGGNLPRVLNFDDEDAGVYWTALAGDAVSCLGLNASPGDEVGGTFLRAAQDTPPTAFPTFIATVDRAS